MKDLDLLPEARRQHVAARLHSNLIAWFTTVRDDGQPTTIPVWFLAREDDVLMFTRPGTRKLRNLSLNPRAVLGLDVTDIGRDNVRIEGVVNIAPDELPADRNPAYLAKYTERIGAMFDDAAAFSAAFSVPLVLTPSRVRTE
ncbi:pyridoxamine 5'-phosphate oxidase family protein [Nakamurella sp. A5-74]|uniref:Pyridoxamine 5'-phosphate oxidase family protein n=1 Tax=Nakamurella sp. A5-74 TaxID=3158264 RepID=A0AAU8DP43_9ACTN